MHRSKAMAPHSSPLAWKTPWTEEPGGLQSMGSQSQTRLSGFTLFLTVLCCCSGSSLVVTIQGYAWTSHCSSFSCCGAPALGCMGFNSCGTWAQKLRIPGSRAQAQQLWHTGLVAPQHVGSSQIRDRTPANAGGFFTTGPRGKP